MVPLTGFRLSSSFLLLRCLALNGGEREIASAERAERERERERAAFTSAAVLPRLGEEREKEKEEKSARE